MPRDPQRPQSVAIERGPDDAAVGEDDRRRPVPGLDEPGVVAVEGRASGSSSSSSCHARGNSIDAAWRTSRPPRTSSSSALSSSEESDPDSSSAPERRAATHDRASRTLPSIALISPLWQSSRNGCARSHEGLVLVEKRWWKIAKGTSSAPSPRSG